MGRFIEEERGLSGLGKFSCVLISIALGFLVFTSLSYMGVTVPEFYGQVKYAVMDLL